MEVGGGGCASGPCVYGGVGGISIYGAPLSFWHTQALDLGLSPCGEVNGLLGGKCTRQLSGSAGVIASSVRDEVYHGPRSLAANSN